MTKPEWGLFPTDYDPKMFWGARAIVKYGMSTTIAQLDIPRDRQNFVADETTGKEDFMFWLNNTVIPRLELMLRQGMHQMDLTSDSGRFRCVADDKSSGGYLYIGAWRV